MKELNKEVASKLSRRLEPIVEILGISAVVCDHIIQGCPEDVIDWEKLVGDLNTKITSLSSPSTPLEAGVLEVLQEIQPLITESISKEDNKAESSKELHETIRPEKPEGMPQEVYEACMKATELICDLAISNPKKLMVLITLLNED